MKKFVIFALLFMIIICSSCTASGVTDSNAARIAQLEKRVAELENQVASLETALKENAALAATSSKVQTMQAGGSPSTQTAPAVTSPNAQQTPSVSEKDTGDSQIVYITKSGTKYHTKGCAYASKGATPITLAEARKKGYTPCSKCNPPK